MSKQLTLSAALSVVALSATALIMGFGSGLQSGGARGATAHGSIVSVLFNA